MDTQILKFKLEYALLMLSTGRALEAKETLVEALSAIEDTQVREYPDPAERYEQLHREEREDEADYDYYLEKEDYGDDD